MTSHEARAFNTLLSQVQLIIDLQILQMEVQYKNNTDEFAPLSLDLLKVRRDKIIAAGQRPAIEDTVSTTWRHPETGQEGTLK